VALSALAETTQRHSRASVHLKDNMVRGLKGVSRELVGIKRLEN
jgi:hypothetical protein